MAPKREVRKTITQIWRNRFFVPFIILLLLNVGAISILVEAPPAHFTDEGDYMPFALNDLVHLRNPYATEHSDYRTIDNQFGIFLYNWHTTYPYLPLLALFQIPFIDYRWTSLVAYGLLLWRLRGKAIQFFAFANPFVLPLAASGFNDFVVLALIAWGQLGKKPILTLLACGCKQLALPLVLLDYALRREWKLALSACLFTLIVIVPFIIISPTDFWRSAITQHFMGEHAKIPEFYMYYNYALYPLYALAVTLTPRISKRPS